MPRKLDHIIVIDLEATCWRTEEEQGDQPSEIIEIGIACLDTATLKPFRKHCLACSTPVGKDPLDCKVCHNRRELATIYIRPTKSEVSNFCTELTGLTADFLRRNGLEFEPAINRLRKWYGPKNRVFASWGNYDRWMVEKWCKELNVQYPLGSTHINVKDLFGLKHKMNKAPGVEAALRKLNLPFIGRPHSGADDAWNIAVLLGEILK